jgi:hypothetical protein
LKLLPDTKYNSGINGALLAKSWYPPTAEETRREKAEKNRVANFAIVGHAPVCA